MILIFKSDLNMVNMYLHTKMNLVAVAVQKLQPPPPTHTQRTDSNYYLSAYVDGNYWMDTTDTISPQD